MDTNYQKFIWSTIKEHCFTSFIGFLLVAFAMAVLMMVHVAGAFGFIGCSLLSMVFGMGWNTARYIESIIQIDIDEQSAG